MEILLIACMLAYAAGAQSEQSKLGLSPAQRAVIREQTRHEKAIRRIAEKHGATEDSRESAASPEKGAGTPKPVVTIPEAFRSGYRSHTPIERVATPLGRRTGRWAATGVAWARDTGRGAVREYRKRRHAGGREAPSPVLVPAPPSYAPKIPPQPTEPLAVISKPPGVTLAKPAGTAKPGPTSPTPVSVKTKEGVGRMAAEVTYESVIEESDELSLMCDDDIQVYGRIRERCEREIGRADELIAALENAGVGPGVIGRVASCKEQYQLTLGHLDDLVTNTVAQGEGVVKAKALLEAGQGIYADIAKDMESVGGRDFYTSDAVDGEDASADTEAYEMKGAA